MTFAAFALGFMAGVAVTFGLIFFGFLVGTDSNGSADAS